MKTVEGIKNVVFPSFRIRALFLLASLVITAILVSPIITRPTSPFYSIDPDIHYVSNAVEWITIGQISYTNHPGTPLHMFLGSSYWPLRVWAKIHHTSFLEWSTVNIDLLLWYSRGFISVIFVFSIYLTLCGWFAISESRTTSLIGIAILLSFYPFTVIPVSIRAENMLFLLFSIWLVLYSVWHRDKLDFPMRLMALCSGVMLASKFTSITIIPITLALGFSRAVKSKKAIFNVVLRVAMDSLLIALGFIVTTWPIHDRYSQIFRWAIALFSHAGVYGGGETKVLDIASWTVHATAGLRSTPWLFLLVLTAIAVLFSRKFTNSRTPGLLLGLSILGWLAFFKYPQDYYQTVNLFLTITAILLIFKSLSTSLRQLVLIVSIILAISTISRQSVNVREEVENSAALEVFVSTQKIDGPAIWEYGKSKPFSLLWSRVWAGRFNAAQLARTYPYLYDLENLSFVGDHNGNSVPIDNLCWNALYIQQVSYSDFITANPQYKSTPFERISGTKMLLLKQPQCVSSKTQIL